MQLMLTGIPVGGLCSGAKMKRGVKKEPSAFSPHGELLQPRAKVCEAELEMQLLQQLCS